LDTLKRPVRRSAHELRRYFASFSYQAQSWRTLAIPKAAEPCSLTSLREKLIKIGAKVVSHRRYATFQKAEVAVATDVRRHPVTDLPAASTARDSMRGVVRCDP
jgi:hypothetical protein